MGRVKHGVIPKDHSKVHSPALWQSASLKWFVGAQTNACMCTRVCEIVSAMKASCEPKYMQSCPYGFLEKALVSR